MTGHDGRDGPERARPGTGVLADRLAAMLVHHEPGWRLPRNTALARRYNVSAAELAAAIDQLTARHLLRRLPDGQVYRASPAEYLVTLDGLPGLGSHVDPMGASIACAARYSTRRRIPEEIGQVLGLAPGDKAITIRCLWTADRDHAALSTIYLPDRPGAGTDPAPLAPLSLDAVLNSGPAVGPSAGLGAGSRLAALCVEVQLPTPSVARTLRLAPGEPAIAVTVSFTGPDSGLPVAVTAAVFRPDLFRIVVEAEGVKP
ncbi:MAG TPA: hypothetical protein VMV07_06280 [Streptosporangiaceae bacterium]|nr:hypothetical protein [Streptosporangiaceae bacterium]